MVAAFALHVLDEALTDFLPLYNSIILDLRNAYAFVPFPTFTFTAWLSGLVIALMILALMTWFVFSGRKPMLYVSYLLSIVMILNGLSHIGASLYWGLLAPGVISSPLLLVTAVALLVATAIAHRAMRVATR